VLGRERVRGCAMLFLGKGQNMFIRHEIRSASTNDGTANGQRDSRLATGIRNDIFGLSCRQLT
jgi:hypothetical protein